MKPDGAYTLAHNIFTMEQGASATLNNSVCGGNYRYNTTNQLAGNNSLVVDANGNIQAAYRRTGTYGVDPGANLPAIAAATTHAQTGIPNPFLSTIKGRAVPTGTTTATIYYTAPDRQTCTVDVSTDPTFSSHVPGYPATDFGGNPARTHNLTGLSSGTTYLWRLTCAAYPAVILDMAHTTENRYMFQTF
jgi:hypothetical protein